MIKWLLWKLRIGWRLINTEFGEIDSRKRMRIRETWMHVRTLEKRQHHFWFSIAAHLPSDWRVE